MITKTKNQIQKMGNDIEGILNDFEGGITEKEETIVNIIDYIIQRAEATVNNFKRDGFPVEAEVMQLLADITKNKLLVRPSLVGGWWVSKWKGVTGLNEAYCDGIIGEGKTILDAVNEWKKLSKQSA